MNSHRKLFNADGPGDVSGRALAMARKTILIVDDEDAVRMLLKGMLAAEGFSVMAVSSGKECLDLLLRKKPDLIIMDQMMPQMTGIDTLKRIKQDPATKDVKVLFLSVVTIKEIGEDILTSLDIIDYMGKPFNHREFIDKVKRAVGLR